MNETKQCPYCGCEIMAVAKKCKHCGEWLDKTESSENVCLNQTHTAIHSQPAEVPANQTNIQKSNQLNLIFALNGFIIIVLLIYLFDDGLSNFYRYGGLVPVLLNIVYIIGWGLLSLGIIGLITGNNPQSLKKEYTIAKTGIIASLIGFLVSLCGITNFIIEFLFETPVIYYIFNLFIYPMALGFGLASALKLFRNLNKYRS